MSVSIERCHYPAERLGIDQLRLLGDLAMTHASGAMEPLEIDPEKYPFQSAYRMDGEKLGPDDIDTLATKLEPRFNQVRDVLKRQDQSAGVNLIGQLLDMGKNVALALPHGPLIDIGLAEAAIYIELAERGHNFKTAILLSQTLQTLGLNFDDLGKVPTAEALGFMCDYVYFSNPQSERHRGSDFASAVGEDDLSSHNQAMKQDLREKFDEGGLLLALAPSGTSDVVESGHYRLAPVTSGTTRLLQHPSLFVQPLAARIIGVRPFHYELVGPPGLIIEEDDTHKIMNRLANSLDASLPDNYRYHKPASS